MNIQGMHSQKSKTNSKWLIWAIYIILILVTEQFYSNPLFKVSIPYIEAVQGKEPGENFLLYAAEIVSYLGNAIYVPIIFVVYNFANIYKSYVLLMTLLLSTAMISILKMIYIQQRPYWVSDKIVPFGCEGGWGNPSGHSLSCTAFYLTLWEIIFECSKLRNKKVLKYTSLGCTIILILMILFSRNFVGAHSLNQILYGGLLGFGLYFFLFHVLCIRLNDSKQFAKFLEFRNLTYYLINFFILLFAFLVYYFNQNNDYLNKWDKAIDTNGCSEIPNNKRLQNEGFITFAIFMTNLGAFMGVKFEYYFTFGENLQNWRQYNFESDEQRDDESLMTKITINKETQWNHTNSFYSFSRFLIILLLCGVLMTPYYFIHWNQNLVIVFIFKLFLPMNLITFSMFFLFKIVLKSLRVVNMTLYSMLHDSI